MRKKKGELSEKKIRKQTRVGNSKCYIEIKDSEALTRILTLLYQCYQIKMCLEIRRDPFR
jgi:hypothetical protein